MRKVLIVIFALLSVSLFTEEIAKTTSGKEVILYNDHTWSEYKKETIDTSELKSQLRSGIKASDQEIQIACEMISQGWKYTMPRPKSPKAGWGISDGRTTWWKGSWYNSKTNLYSDTTPKKTSSGLYLGDNQDSSGSWRNGGSPSQPDIYMFLLSDSGGPL